MGLLLLGAYLIEMQAGKRALLVPYAEREREAEASKSKEREQQTCKEGGRTST